MRKTLKVDGTNLRTTYRVEINGYETYSAPKKIYKFYTIPAKNGLLASSEKRFDNIIVKYKAGIAQNFATNIDGLRAFLLSREGYVRIEDGYHAGEFRKGIYEGPFVPEISDKYEAAEFELEFNCMPQRFLTSGETATTYNYSASSQTITNSTKFASKPLLRVYGYGTFTLNGRRVTIAQHSQTYIDIDCETMESYRGTTSYNNYVTVTAGSSPYLPTVDFPTLKSGSNSLTFADNTITKIDITPRWFTL